MTKQVRIENADTSDHTIIVETWNVSGNDAPDVLIKTDHLKFPTQLIELYVFKEQYLVIKEE
jgi:hypothetical protein